MVAMKRLKDPPTWLKVATTLEKPPTPTHRRITRMAITLDLLRDDLGSWKQSQKLIHTALFKSKANNRHQDFVNPTAALEDCW